MDCSAQWQLAECMIVGTARSQQSTWQGKRIRSNKSKLVQVKAALDEVQWEVLALAVDCPEMSQLAYGCNNLQVAR